MNNMNQRFGGRGAYRHPRPQGLNNNIYAQTRNIIPVHTRNIYNTQFSPPPPLRPPPPSSNNSISGRTSGFSNSNYLVTHRVQQQYSVQVLNPTDQQHRQSQPINNNTVGDPTFPQQQVSSAPAPPQNNNAQEIQQDSSFETAIVPYTNAVNSSASNNPSTITIPNNASSSANPVSTEVIIETRGVQSFSELEKCHKILGEEIAKEKVMSVAKTELLEKMLIEIEKLKAQNKALLSQVSTIEQEKDNQARNFGEVVAHEQKEAARARQELFTWRNNAIRCSEQLDSLKGQLTNKDKNIESLENQIAEVKRENSGNMQRIQNLEQNEKKNKAEIVGKNNMIEQYKMEIRKKNDDLANVDLKLKGQMKRMKQLDDEMNTLKRELNMEILNEKKRVNELEANVTEWKNKFTTVKKVADSYEADNEKLEGDKVKLENEICEQNKSIERKDDEILKLTEERDSIQLEKEITDKMLKDLSVKTKDLKTAMDKLEARNAHLSKELEEEREIKNTILQDHMDFYTRSSLLNHLVHQKMKAPPLAFVAAMDGQLEPQINSSRCSSPEASEEVPESVAVEHHKSHENLEETQEIARKRKHSTCSNGENDEVRQKDPKISEHTTAPMQQRDKTNQPGSNQLKGQEEGESGNLRGSSSMDSQGVVSSVANKNVHNTSSGVNGAARSDKGRKTKGLEGTIKIDIPNPNINFRKTK